jgi:hypothetical protein
MVLCGFASRRMMVEQRPMLLLDLPDPCLLKVLQCCADDQRSLFNAARAHPTLHRAAVVALSSISVDFWRQRKVDGAVLLYLSKYRQHVRAVTFAGYPENYRGAIHMRELPPDLQLNRLELTSNLNVQLQPGGCFQGVVRPGVPLTQLVISQCNMLDGTKLAAALALLPGLQHLAIRSSCQHVVPAANSRRCGGWVDYVVFPANRLPQLQQLTFLELVDIDPQVPGSRVPDLQPLSSLTRLAALALKVSMPPPLFTPNWAHTAITSSMLSGMQYLTSLRLSGYVELGPGFLGSLTQLQHLAISPKERRSDTHNAGVTQWLHQLQHMQQLTLLRLEGIDCNDGSASAASFNVVSPDSEQQASRFGCDRVPHSRLASRGCLAACVPCWQAAAAPAKAGHL